MKSFVVLATVLAVAYAKPGLLAGNGLVYSGLGYSGLGYSTLGYSGLPIQYAGGPIQYSAAPVHYAAPLSYAVPAVTKTQYHAQDEFGQSSHGYAHPGQAAAEVRDAFGNVRGSYAYVDPNGKEVRVNYVADAVNGFRVESNALPVGPSVPETPALIAPEPVQDTPEVAQAKVEHAAAVEAARSAAAAAPEEPAQAASRKKRGIVYSSLAAPAVTYAAAPAYTYAAHPAYTYAAHPAYTYAAAPALTYAAAPALVAAPAVAVRQATLTKVVNNPGHAVSYNVA